MPAGDDFVLMAGYGQDLRRDPDREAAAAGHDRGGVLSGMAVGDVTVGFG